MLHSGLEPHCTTIIINPVEDSGGPQLGIWSMSLGFESSSESTWLDSSVILMFSLFSSPHFLLLLHYFTLFFSPLRFFSFSAAGGEDASIREGGRWNRGSLPQSMVTCTVDTCITCCRYTLQYHHLPSQLYTGEAPQTVPTHFQGYNMKSLRGSCMPLASMLALCIHCDATGTCSK